jgi:hypothetical protein
LVPDEWQERVIDCWLGRNARGKWSANECGLLVPRQNGKNAVLEIRELYGLAILGEKFLHTAHQVKTAREAFIRICGYFENEQDWPELAEMVRDIRKTNGQEAIELVNGGSVRFVARSRGSARGFTADVLVLDEAQELTDEQMQALQPTLSAALSKNSQVIMCGTPPGPTAPGEVLRKWRTNALANNDKRLAWHEWSVEAIGDVTDRDRWYATNPALGTRISLVAVESELTTLSEDGFARERLGHWSEIVVDRVIQLAEWAPCAISLEEAQQITGRRAFGVKFSPQGNRLSVAACVRPVGGGKPYIECIRDVSIVGGTAEIREYLLERWRTTALIAVDGLNGAGALVEELRQEKVSKKAVVLVKTGDVTKASSMLLSAIREQRIVHMDQPALNESALKSHKRPIGNNGGWGFGSTDEVDSTPIEACSLAYWAAMTTKRNPGKGMMVGW